MDNIVYVVMYTLPGCHPELVSIHKTEEIARASKDKMENGNQSLSQHYCVNTWTLEN